MTQLGRVEEFPQPQARDGRDFNEIIAPAICTAATRRQRQLVAKADIT